MPNSDNNQWEFSVICESSPTTGPTLVLIIVPFGLLWSVLRTTIWTFFSIFKTKINKLPIISSNQIFYVSLLNWLPKVNDLLLVQWSIFQVVLCYSHSWFACEPGDHKVQKIRSLDYQPHSDYYIAQPWNLILISFRFVDTSIAFSSLSTIKL